MGFNVFACHLIQRMPIVTNSIPHTGHPSATEHSARSGENIIEQLPAMIVMQHPMRRTFTPRPYRKTRPGRPDPQSRQFSRFHHDTGRNIGRPTGFDSHR